MLYLKIPSIKRCPQTISTLRLYFQHNQFIQPGLICVVSVNLMSKKLIYNNFIGLFLTHFFCLVFWQKTWKIMCFFYRLLILIYRKLIKVSVLIKTKTHSTSAVNILAKLFKFDLFDTNWNAVDLWRLTLNMLLVII